MFRKKGTRATRTFECVAWIPPVEEMKKRSRSHSSANPDRPTPTTVGGKSAGAKMRDRSTIKRLAMYRQRPKHDAKGNVIRGGLETSPEKGAGRVQPNRKWFGIFVFPD